MTKVELGVGKQVKTYGKRKTKKKSFLEKKKSREWILGAAELRRWQLEKKKNGAKQRKKVFAEFGEATESSA